MKILFTCTILIALNGYAQENPRPLEGPVKEVVEKFYTGGEKQVFSRKVEYFYNKNGKQISRFEYKKFIEADYSEIRNDREEHANDEVFNLVYVNDFDEEGRLTRKFRNERIASNDKDYLFYQDENGNDTLMEIWNLVGYLLETCTYKHDEKGNVVAWKGWDAKREITSTVGKASFTYYDDGSIKEKVLDSVTAKKAFPVTTFKYSQDGQLLEEYHLNSSRKKVYHHKAELQDGKLKRFIKYKDGRENVIYTYNLLGQELTMAKYKVGMTEPVFVRSYEYNTQGNLSHMEMLQTQGAIKIEWGFEYEYDEHNNWVSRRESENDREFRVTLREIQYYR
ncbi:hypothetical protein JYT74_02000 [Crocinitomix catalasitica]|nr:hypothetical protein [Crocinitomix catalasitica]